MKINLKHLYIIMVILSFFSLILNFISFYNYAINKNILLTVISMLCILISTYFLIMYSTTLRLMILDDKITNYLNNKKNKNVNNINLYKTNGEVDVELTNKYIK